MATPITDHWIDVGAGNKNEYNEWLNKKPHVRIHAIEPHPDLAQNLRNMFAEHIKNERIFVYEFACLALNAGRPLLNRTTDFYLCNQKTCSSTLDFSAEGIVKWRYPAGAQQLVMTGKITVPAMALSDFIDTHIKSYRHLRLNVDVQGDSLKVLQGIRQTHWESMDDITVKVHTDKIDKTDLYVGQAKEKDVIAIILKNEFKKESEVIITRGQEKILKFNRTILVLKKEPAKTLHNASAMQTTKKIVGVARVPRFK